MQLSPAQMRIVNSKEDLVVVSAGPGSGKTSGGIIPRICHLLMEGAPPASIALVAFTRTAADDLKEKIRRLKQEYSGLEGTEVDRIWVSTVHSLCLGYLSESGCLEDGNRSARMLLNHEKKRMLYDLELEERNIDLREKLLHAFEADWITDAERYPGRYIPAPEEASFEADVWRWMLRHRCMIIGEVVPLAHREIINLPDQDVLPQLMHLVVDEYQDLNGLEQGFIESLARNRKLVVVGDDDQSIYAFKHAHPQGIRSLVARGGEDGVDVIEMVECRRSPANVVHAANSLMRTDYQRSKPDMIPTNTRVGFARVVSWNSQQEEIDGVTRAVVDAINRRQVPINEILILVPNRIIGNQFVHSLTQGGTSALGYFDQDILDKNPLAWHSISLLDLLKNPEDPLAWRMIWSDAIKDPYDNAERYRELVIEAIRRNVSVLALVREYASTKCPRRYSGFVRLLNETEDLLQTYRGQDIRLTLDTLFPNDAPQLVPIRLITDELISQGQITEVSEIVDQLRSRLAVKHLPENPDAVRVMTYHKSKGLTAGSVFVCSLIEGLIPKPDPDLTPEGLEEHMREARRLLYVAMTRTSSDLILSSFREIDSHVALSMGASNLRYVGRNLQSARPSQMLTQLGGYLGQVVSGDRFLVEYQAAPIFESLG